MGFGTVGLGVAERLATVAHTLQGQFGEALTIEGILIRDKDKYQARCFVMKDHKQEECVSSFNLALKL